MPDDESRELTLYVESKKAVTHFYRAGSLAPATAQVGNNPLPTSADTRGGDASSSLGESVFFLSDEHARCVAFTEDLAKRRGYHVKVVDIAKTGRLERLVTERLRGVSQLPALVSPTGLRLEGPAAFTEEAVCELMPTELRSVRAFTYVKVKGGDFERIREVLVALPQVKELHFLTGDWDIFVVLEFPSAQSRKREVIDFVTDKIRSLPDIVDTSTLVPEYTITKFAI
ncbi:MAG: Lrp/AsnC ligand binding domain-containing protein [Thermoplasmatales archaeon]|nr:Lrp/AsnC ligand binding domain-containing protein [Thermoplasmatales archaeon]